MLHYSETPILPLNIPELEKYGVRLIIKREDLNHPAVSGNKWWKLKFNLEETCRHNSRTILTFGGAFSNHIYATAAAAKEAGLRSIGIIRGEQVLPLNDTLSFATKQGMELHYISREEYRKKNDVQFINDLKKKFGDFFLVPEGGSNSLAVKGCEEFFQKKLEAIDFDYVCLPVGTGGTIAGLICGLKGKKNIIGFPVLKNGEFLEKDIKALVKNFSGSDYGNWRLITSYHHGGYAKVSDLLKWFIVTMSDEHNLLLDPIYTGKLLYGVVEEIRKKTFPIGSTVLVIHTGGLQGAASLMR